MSDLFWLSKAQMRRIEPYFPLSHGIPRVDDRRVISGIILSSGTGYAGGMRRETTVRTRPSTTGSSAGVAWVCSTGSSPNLWARQASRTR